MDLNLAELKYYPFTISVDKCPGNCNVLPSKVRAPKKKKHKNFKVFNVITNKNQAKTMKKLISHYWKCEFNCSTCHSNHK